MKKVCTICCKAKPLVAFHNNPMGSFGVYSICKVCRAKRSKGVKNEYYRKYNRTVRKPQLKLRLTISEEAKRNTKNKCYNDYRRANPFKIAARQIVRHSITLGLLERPDVCSECGKVGKIDAHHEDYFKPLDVMWLCRGCHKTLHGGFRNANKTKARRSE